ncbi:Mannitol dehydrogenase domain-containing protein [Rhizobium sp. PDO1-076]|uniref:mannitol dehydrogenase family protein n=1 Tax=Rhizobium sp. PDO1-076 TaxID=1125979 RepID=UPI00024E23E2|nr:mannitol dehydrogenase family protein [Rhizobium sp. PDO1-076]EHS51191.1 Mannitol dehydrogenase domain-containing protein [Rhizobium sp. PDO1-076]
MQLSSSSPFAGGVLSPQYDRAKLKPGIVHIGFGAFHRAHQAVYTDTALAASFGDWGIVGVSLRSSEPIRDLKMQDHLFSVIARDASGAEPRVVGSVVGGISAANDRDGLLVLLADPAIRIVSLTVTEKAYGFDPASGGLDRRHPAIAADLVAPGAPVGVIGFLVEGLSRRKRAGLSPFTVLCCDNLPTNGRVVERLVLEMAEAQDPALASWIAAEGAFPCTMVDRIVPAATDETRRRAADLLGVEDKLALDTEPFMQWVIEDRFVSGRPEWESAGALFVADVEPYEKMKLRMLNGPHSMIAYLGQLKGLEYVKDVMAVPDYAERVRQHMAAAALTLDPVPGIDLDEYREQLIERFSNPTIAHRTKQIAMDGSQKLPQRIFAAAVDDLAAGRDAAVFAEATALWIAYVMQNPQIEDPRAAELCQASAAVDSADPSGCFLALPGLFPPRLAADRDWRDLVNAALNLELRAA